ncbi:ATP-binding protein [Rubrivirga sp. IMCC45206]|uniref:ATP-binding protein n=1 Tax=Rubrivirga sp. IMCC45206 TaxID=3391614 RepID=UPI0039900C98
MTLPSPLRLAALVGLGLLATAAAAQDASPAADWNRSIDAISGLLADADGDRIPDRLGAPALVAGRVTVGTGVLRSDVAEIYIQDGTGGLRLFLPPEAGAVLTGDSVMVAGTLGFRAGTAEMVAPSVRTVAGPEREVVPVALDAVDRERGRRGPDLEGHEGEIVQIEGRVLEIADSPSGQALVILSGTDLIQVFSYAARPEPVVFDALRIGDYVRVTGVASQSDAEPPFTGGYVVYPLVQADVRKSGLSPTEYRYSVIGAVVLLLVALLWAVMLRRQVRRRGEALRASEVRYGHLFDAAADPVVVLDVGRGGEIVEANRAAQKAFGVDVNGDRADGRPVRLSELAADEQESALHLAEAETRGAASGTLELLETDGTVVPYEIATRQLRDRSTFVAVARNVTERRNYEHGLLTAISAAEEAREQAEEAARLKSSILANMSHEIRTPLTAILGFADILREEVPEDLYEYADTIHGGGQRLLDTLNDILDFARLDAERASVLPEPIDAALVVRESVGLLAPLAQRKGLGLHLQSSSASVPAVHSASALGRVLTNLVGNAIKFTEKGEVRVSLHAAPTFFAIRVQDTGVGIADEFLPELYEAFKQESDGHRRDFEGTGLGLAITKRLVDLMGGEIRVWSKKGEGTLFEVALPIESPSAPDAPDGALLGDAAGDGAADPVTLGQPA